MINCTFEGTASYHELFVKLSQLFELHSIIMTMFLFHCVYDSIMNYSSLVVMSMVYVVDVFILS